MKEGVGKGLEWWREFGESHLLSLRIGSFLTCFGGIGVLFWLRKPYWITRYTKVNDIPLRMLRTYGGKLRGVVGNRVENTGSVEFSLMHIPSFRRKTQFDSEKALNVRLYGVTRMTEQGEKLFNNKILGKTVRFELIATQDAVLEIVLYRRLTLFRKNLNYYILKKNWGTYEERLMEEYNLINKRKFEMGIRKLIK